MILRFTVEGKPQPKERARRGKGGRWYTPDGSAEYMARVRAAAIRAHSRAQPLADTPPPAPINARNAAWAFVHGPVEVTVWAFYPDRRTRDGDNVYKGVLDGLQPRKKRRRKVGIGLIADDSQVVDHHIHERLDADGPRIEVTVRAVEWRDDFACTQRRAAS